MTIRDALKNVLELLEAEGYTSGGIHDDLELVVARLSRKYPDIAQEEL